MYNPMKFNTIGTNIREKMSAISLMSILKSKRLLSVLIGILLIGGAIYLTYQYMSTRTQADQAEVAYSLKAGSCQTTNAANTCKISGNTNQPISIDIDLSSGSYLSGVDLIFSYNRVTPGQLEFVSYKDTLNSFGTEVIKEVHSHPQGYNLLHLTLVNKGDDSKLVKRAVIRLTFKGTRTGVTRVNLISSASTVVGPGASGAYTISPQSNISAADDPTMMKNIPNIHVTTTSGGTPPGDGTPNPSGTNPSGPISPPISGPSGPIVVSDSPEKILPSAKVNYRIKFQGITGQPKNATSIDAKLGIYRASGEQIDTRSVKFTPQADGTWVADTEYKNIPDTNYYVTIKGPKHLQKKICEINPKEVVSGTYRCKDGGINFKENNTFDFSQIYMLAGDLPLQNGIIDAVDIIYIRSNFGSQTAEVIARGDLNYDGIVDSQDYTIILNALAFKYDETE
ncbi:hypothetical protein COY16_00805 [Candidatus Roizmanbacteria bacterium CG_4_10_14_0_2_um_filter_39_13]|uniref:Dockerin domain-containing protein n=1 Tax=Candidatus Roizmanbacteria bacterium CG_4_10_14_0_2_um_filter_39_13 TaxID=1974825 RepID=A0A2M7U1D2_9BACT|nr:MAG: hypothetical protein COY16_00805 [Candidatus Roizmanbacteria bacterium CG_4_10_14_0_2_um_filter_39_13]